MKKTVINSCLLTAFSLLMANTAFAQNREYNPYQQRDVNTFDSTAVPGQQTNSQGSTATYLGAQPADEKLKFQRNAKCVVTATGTVCPQYEADQESSVVAAQGYVQTYETLQVNNCGDGTAGTSTYTRKVYTKAASGTEAANRYEEPWYLTKNGCEKVSPSVLSPGMANDVVNMTNQSTAGFINALNNVGLNGNQAAQAQAMVNSSWAGGAAGTFATPVFNNSYTDFNGNAPGTGGNITYSGRSVCVWGRSENVEVRLRAIVYTSGQGLPYPGWQATSNNGNIYAGPLCPAGSGIQNTELRRGTQGETAGGNE